jgi:O-antigen/teichoic acid export membrane protein
VVSLRTTSRKTVKDSAVIAVAMGVMNITTYGFVILAARLLGPAEYGALAAVMGVLLVVNVLSLGLQATGARRVSAAPERAPEIEHEVLSTSYRSALLLGLVVLVASPLITLVLHLDSWLPVALVGVTAVPLSIMGGQAGILQGERRWGPLAGIYLSMGLGRLIFGTIGVQIDQNTVGAMVGVTVGAFVPTVIGWLALRHPNRAHIRRAAPPGRATPGWERGGVFYETAHNSHALLAFFALSNADVIIARVTLDEHQAGLYAGGLILSKAVLFLPQFVVVIAFPRMSSRGADKRMHLFSLGAVMLIGLVTTVGVLVLSSIAVSFVGGSQYSDLEGRLWIFAFLGTLLAMLQLMIYNIVARQRQRTVLLVWAAFLVLYASTPFIDSMNTLLTVVVTVDALLFALLLARSLTSSYFEKTPPVATTTDQQVS